MVQKLHIFETVFLIGLWVFRYIKVYKINYLPASDEFYRCKQFLTRIRPNKMSILLDFSLTVKAATLIFISGCGSAILSAKEGKSGCIYNLVKN